MPTSKQEKVDFLIGDALATEPYGLIQVCANMGNEKTRAREIGSLQAAMQRTNVDSGLILTLNEGETIELPDSTGTIHVLPLLEMVPLRSVMGRSARMLERR